jgi:hypothetical protein
MRDMARNRKPIYYALYEGNGTDKYGNPNADKTYSEPVQISMSISANKGEAQAESFGADIQYDRVMTITDPNCPIDEYAILWVDGHDISKEHNYEVAAVSRSLTNVKYAIRKVEVAYG